MVVSDTPACHFATSPEKPADHPLWYTHNTGTPQRTTMKLKHAEGQYLAEIMVSDTFEVKCLEKRWAVDWPEELAQNLICLLADLGYVFTGDEDE